MGSADYYADGQWNFYCDFCGRKEKSSLGRKTWNGYQVCARHQEVRNPQDFVRGVKENQATPWSRPQPPDTFVESDFQLTQEDGAALLQEVDAFTDFYPILRN